MRIVNPIIVWAPCTNSLCRYCGLDHGTPGAWCPNVKSLTYDSTGRVIRVEMVEPKWERAEKFP